MSLINEALKKAQKHRSGDPADILPASAVGEVSKRGQPRSTQQLILLSAGGLVLVVLSVVITVWLVNRAPAEKPVAKPVASKPVPATTTASAPAAAPVIVAPVITPPAVAPEKPVEKPAPTPPVQKSAAPVASTVATTQATPPPAPPPAPQPTQAATRPATEQAATTKPPVAPPVETQSATATPAAPGQAEPAGPPKTDDRVHQFVDAIKVTGIRSAGAESRVMMNDRVFRVNDIVERNLGVRLTKVEPDALTFTDANGAVYVKHF